MSQLGRTAGLTGFLDLCQEVGLDAYALASAVGLPPTVLTDPDLRVSVEAMGKMFEAAAAQSGVEDFALRIAERRRISNMGAVGLVIREQPTVRKALQMYARFQWMQNDAYALIIEDYGDNTILRINGPPWQQRQTAELSLATALKTLRAIMSDAWKPLELWLPHAAPERLDTYRRVLGLTPRFAQDGMAIVIRRSDLDLAVPSADPAIARQLALHLERLTEERSLDLATRVGDLIVALLPDGDCNVERVAQRLGMDRRTLHRRLSAQGATFSSILDDTRRDIAASLLTGSDRPLQSIADLLGFSSLSAFAHWFRRKFDQSAGAYRAANAGGVLRPSGSLMLV